MQPIKTIKTLFLGILIHALILWIALALGYNSYKKFMSDIEPLTRAVRDSIKSTFPWAILIFSGIYFFILIRKKVESAFLSVWQYVFAIGLYAVMINLLILSKGKDVFIPLHLSIFYFGILLLISTGVRRLITINLQPLSSNLLPAQDWLPPIVYKFLINNLPRAQAYIKEKPSALFIIAFMTLLIICAFFLIFKAEKAAEQLANIAYFSLVIGVGIELYQMIKHKNTNEEKKD
jgi:hypothetical protein